MDILFDQVKKDISLEESALGFDLAITNTVSDDLVQRLFLKFKTFARELFWNQGYGIDFLRDVFGDGRPKSTVDAIIYNELLKEEMIKSIDGFESEVTNYTYACKFQVTPIEEQTTITYYILTTETGITITDQHGDVLTTRI